MVVARQITKALKTNKKSCQSGIPTRAHQCKRDQTMRSSAMLINCYGSGTRERVSPTQVKEITQGCATQDVWNEDETGSFWKAQPEKSLSVGGKCYRVGKNYIQRVTVAFFLSAAGGKESPVLIGKSKKPHCFLKLKDASHPCGALYFSNDKAWICTEID